MSKQNMPTPQRQQHEQDSCDESSLLAWTLEEFEEFLKNKNTGATRKSTVKVVNLLLCENYGFSLKLNIIQFQHCVLCGNSLDLGIGLRKFEVWQKS